MRSFDLARLRETDHPSLYQEISQKIGDEAAAKLVEEYGGIHLYIPCKLKLEHPLCQLLGQKLAQQLSDEYGGMTVAVSRAFLLQKKQRNELILADRVAGMSQSQLARKYQLTMRAIRNITNSQPRKEVV